MNYLDFPRVGERMYREVLENGLHVFVFPKPEFQKSYAFFATNYGGMDLRFCLDGTWHDTPAGVAHYLEHKMFDTADGSAMQELAKGGAEPNAFTSNAITGYYFECTEQFEENLKTLLSFVSVPYFTQESVDKEQGIIGQEIGMIEDDPDWKVFTNLMKGLYEHHPIRLSVAGSVESIARITPQTLYDCHKAFYDPANMVLCVAGNQDPERVCRIAREILPKTAGPIAQKDYGPQEPEGAFQSLVEERLAVSGPIFQLGCKGDAPERGEAGLRQQMGGESRDPEAVRAAVEAEARRIEAEGVDPGLWDRVKKGVYGWRVRSLNSFETLCVNQAQNFFAGREYLRFADLFADIRKEDVEALIARWVTPARTSLSVIRPKEVG